MKRYRLYGEFDGSPIAMQAKFSYELMSEMSRLQGIMTKSLWYAIYRSDRYGCETMLTSDVIIGHR
jgi:hypothetical protein